MGEPIRSQAPNTFKNQFSLTLYQSGVISHIFTFK